MSTRKLLVLGIMSGTSIDSVDYALCRAEGRKFELLDHWRVAFPTKLRQRLHDAARGSANSHEVGQLHHDLGRFFARHAQNSRRRWRPQLVGLHGQTIFHRPTGAHPATFQLGEPAYLAESLRVPVVNNFRAADLAAGGEGAPLATMFHQMVFGRKGLHVCVNNLGGISNVTSIDWRGERPKIAAFDTGPANVLLDLAMRHFTGSRKQMDRGGAWAARGTPSETLLREWLQDPYFTRKPPKSTGRETFGETFWRLALPRIRKAGLSRFDVLATLTEFTARSIVLNYRLHLRAKPQTVILTGGGAANPKLVASIRAAMAEYAPEAQVLTSESSGWPIQSIEAAAFALLAYLSKQGKPGNLPQTTGATRAVRLGQISHG